MELTNATIVAQFNTVIGEIARAQARATKGIGKALVMCVYASIEMKDAGMTTALLKCLRKSTKQTAIKAFIEHYGNICIPVKGDPVHFDAKREWTAEYKKEVMTAAQTWEDFRVEAEVQALDVVAKLEKLLKDVDSAVKNNREVEHAPLVAMLRNTLASYTAGEALATAAGGLRRAA
jgi:hypothetical protein